MTPSIHVSSGRKGKAVEHLVAALCVLGSDGKLNAWTSFVWLVPSEEFAAASPVRSNGKHKFNASAKSSSEDMWARYVVTKSELPSRLLMALEQIR